jgi:hypothetical protein
LEHSLVGHPPCDRRHQFVVMGSIKEFLKIEIHHPAMACGDVLLCLGYRLMLSAFLDSSMDLRNPLNRRTRTRIYGGVAGADG